MNVRPALPRLPRHPLVSLALCAAWLGGCGSSEDSTPAPVEQDSALTYYRDAKVILEKSCVGCHSEGGVAPFALDDYADVKTHAASVAAAVESGTMPPWKPDASCNSYQGDLSLAADDRETLLSWIAAGSVEGKVADYVAPGQAEDPFRADVSLMLPEPYMPLGSPDDYRCFIVPWTEQSAKFITGFNVEPDVVAQVHHVLLFRADPQALAAFQAMDDNDPGPGYTCFGGPVVGGAQAGAMPMNLGGWVPGARGNSFPKDVGIRIEPGSAIVVQMHYNTSHSTPSADQSGFSFSLADSVKRPALSRLITDPRWLEPGGMVIPAGEASVHHRAELDLGRFLQFLGASEIGLAAGDPYVIHRVTMHMHELGTRGRVALARAGEESCLLDIPEWDFHWQGAYTLAQPVAAQANDKLVLECWWDNSPANQAGHHGGEAHEPIDVEWGEGTRDEMCLTGVLVTAE
jgi:hypothetical protein